MAPASVQRGTRPISRAGIDKYEPMYLTGVVTMDAKVTRRSSARIALGLGQVQMLCWCQSGTRG
jgi:hypothetical protein